SIVDSSLGKATQYCEDGYQVEGDDGGENFLLRGIEPEHELDISARSDLRRYCPY
ncbi:hypothetical protein FRB95_000353, partial [Tulasnella sp. JGI-2019a]